MKKSTKNKPNRKPVTTKKKRVNIFQQRRQKIDKGSGYGPKKKK